MLSIARISTLPAADLDQAERVRWRVRVLARGGPLRRYATATLLIALFLGIMAPATLTSVVASASVDGSAPIVFSSLRDGNSELYSVQPDGSGLRRLTNHSALDAFPSLSPDGTRVAFVSTRAGNSELYVMNLDGTGLVRLTNHKAIDSEPDWSPDGTRIAFTSGRTGNGDIYTASSSDGGGLVRLTTHSGIDISPAWSPDGTQLAFVSLRSGLGDVYVMKADGSGSRRLTTSILPDLSPAWSPDGSTLAFASLRSGNSDIYTMKPDGSQQLRLTRSAAVETEPAWSPDGTELLMASSASGNFDLYRLKADGTGATVLAPHSRLDASPDWAHGTAGLPALTVDRSSAPAGGLITFALPSGVAADGSLSLLIGDQPASVVRLQDGTFAAGVPLFLDPATTWPAPPVLPVDVVLSSDGVQVAAARGALRVTELTPAPGSAQQAQASMTGIVASLDRIGMVLATEPGAQEGWTIALTQALDELVNGSDPRSLAGALAAADPETRQLLDAWFAHSGLLAALAQFDAEVAAAADALATGNPALAATRLALAVGPDPASALQMSPLAAPSYPTDLELSQKMQFYETAKLFAQMVIADTNKTWSTYFGPIAGAISLVKSVPAVTVTSAILATVDIAVNKIFLGLLPANLDANLDAANNPIPGYGFELTLASTLLDRGETTDAFLHVVAVNDPPAIGLQDLLGFALNLMGLKDGPAITSLKDAFFQTTNFFVGLIHTNLVNYASTRPGLNMDTNVPLSVPALRWEATITDPSLVERRSETPAVIAGLPNAVNWIASDTECGAGSVYARTVTFAFGDDLRDSNVVPVDVQCVQVSVSPGFVDLAPLGTQQFTATVTGASNVAVNWSASDGVITSGGFYTAPAQVGTYTITATSVEDPTQSEAATVTVESLIAVTVSPSIVTVVPLGTQQFAGTVTGATNTDVSWSASGGAITSGGLYTAPALAGTYTITATSVQDPTKSGTATVTVETPGAVATLNYTSGRALTGGGVTSYFSGSAVFPNPGEYYTLTSDTPSGGGSASISGSLDLSTDSAPATGSGSASGMYSFDVTPGPTGIMSMTASASISANAGATGAAYAEIAADVQVGIRFTVSGPPGSYLMYQASGSGPDAPGQPAYAYLREGIAGSFGRVVFSTDPGQPGNASGNLRPGVYHINIAFASGACAIGPDVPPGLNWCVGGASATSASSSLTLTLTRP